MMGRIAFGSPEAQDVLAADKKAEALDRERSKNPEREWELVYHVEGMAIAVVKARTQEEALEIASRGTGAEVELQEWCTSGTPFNVIAL